MSAVRLARRLHQAELRALALLQPLFLLALRAYFGYRFFKAGRGKLENLATTAEQFGEWGIPLPELNAVLAGTTECVGGLCLLAGLASRVVTIPLAFTMLVAYFTVHADEPFVAAAPFPFLMTTLVVLLFGPGVLSLDALIGRLLPRAGAGPDGR
jgi:putative oxidoreductase